MPRVLTVQRTTVPLAERARYIERMRELAAHYAASNCRFAFFEDAGLRGAFIELTEADDVSTLEAAVTSAPANGPGPLRLYHHMEVK